MNKYMVETVFFDADDRGLCDISEEFLITSAGYYMEENGTAAPIRNVNRTLGRKDYHFCYVKNGLIVLTVGEKSYNISKACFIIPPGVSYHYYNVCKDSPYEIYWVHFTGSHVAAKLKELNLSEICYMIGDLDEIPNLIETIVKELTFKLDQYKSITESLFIYCLSLVARRSGTMKHEAENISVDLRMQRTLEYIYLYYGTNISIKDLSELCQLSTSRFSALFKKTFGLFPLQYIINYRIKRAGSLLRNTSYSVTQIGEMCGFEDSLYFSRVFKKQTGVNPTTYRSKMTPIAFDSKNIHQ